jgi:GT2 family glycosyltransferase
VTPAGEPAVSIVVVNWEGWHDTLECLASLRELHYGRVHVAVVDNGSRDDSVRQLRLAVPEVTLLVSDANLGYGGGCNIGIRDAFGRAADYVWLLNNDVKVHPDALRALVDAGERDPGLGGIGSVLHEATAAGRVQNWGGGSIHPVLGILQPHVAAVDRARLDYLCGASLLLRSTALREVGLLDERYSMYWEDVELSWRLRAAGWTLGVAEGAVVWHKGSASIGRNSPEYHRHFNASAARFFRATSRWPLVPITLGVGLRLGRRLTRGEWAQAKAIFRSVSGEAGPPRHPVKTR